MLPGCYKAGWERKTFVVCGERLHPLTLGHARVLYLAESPLVVKGKEQISVEDLFLAVAICSRPVAPTFAEVPALTSVGPRLKTDSLKVAIQEFGQYLRYWLAQHPRFQEHPGEPRIPWPWLYVGIMQAEYHMSEAQAWAMTTADALWRLAVLGVWNGSKEYATLDDLAIDELWDDREAAPPVTGDSDG